MCHLKLSPSIIPWKQHTLDISVFMDTLLWLTVSSEYLQRGLVKVMSKPNKLELLQSLPTVLFQAYQRCFKNLKDLVSRRKMHCTFLIVIPSCVISYSNGFPARNSISIVSSGLQMILPSFLLNLIVIRLSIFSIL